MSEGYYDNKGSWRPSTKSWVGSLIPICIINSLAMVIADKFLSGLQFASLGSVFIAALFFTLVNWGIKPLIHMLALPITVLSFGVFALIINGFMLEIVAFFSPGFTINNFGTAILGSIIITVSNMIINAILPKH